jgi:hypothetical protein
MIMAEGGATVQPKVLPSGETYRLTPRDQVWSWASHSILDYVRKEARQNHAYEESENRNVLFMGTAPQHKNPNDKYS